MLLDEIEKKVAPDSLAMALPIRVLPVPEVKRINSFFGEEVGRLWDTIKKMSFYKIFTRWTIEQ